MICVIGSLRNPEVITIGNKLREQGFDVFDDFMAAGPEADDYWKAYEQARGRTYLEALDGRAAKHVRDFDREHLDASSTAVLVFPAGRSACIEFGIALGQGKPGFILLDNPDRWDVMLGYATGVFDNVDELVTATAAAEKEN